MQQPVRLDEGMMNRARGVIAGLQNFGEPFGWGNSNPFIGGNEHLESLWLESENRILYSRYGTGDLHYAVYDVNRSNQPSGVYPRIEFENIEITADSDVKIKTPERIGLPDYQKEVQATPVLYPGSEYEVTFAAQHTHTVSMSEAITEGLESAIKARLGSFSSPAGLELGETVKNSITRDTGHSNGDTNTVTSRYKVTNPYGYPVRVHVGATREISKMRTDCVGLPHFDHAIRYFPIYGHMRNSNAYWSSTREFLDSMKGLAGDDIGVVTTNWGRKSFSTIGRTNKANANLNISNPDIPIDFVAEYDEIHESFDPNFEPVWDPAFKDKYPPKVMEMFEFPENGDSHPVVRGFIDDALAELSGHDEGLP